MGSQLSLAYRNGDGEERSRTLVYRSRFSLVILSSVPRLPPRLQAN